MAWSAPFEYRQPTKYFRKVVAVLNVSSPVWVYSVKKILWVRWQKAFTVDVAQAVVPCGQLLKDLFVIFDYMPGVIAE